MLAQRHSRTVPLTLALSTDVTGDLAASKTARAIRAISTSVHTNVGHALPLPRARGSRSSGLLRLVLRPLALAGLTPPFRAGPAPTRSDIADVAARVEKRMCCWRRRRGLLNERAAEDRSNEARSPRGLRHKDGTY